MDVVAHSESDPSRVAASKADLTLALKAVEIETSPPASPAWMTG